MPNQVDASGAAGTTSGKPLYYIHSLQYSALRFSRLWPALLPSAYDPGTVEELYRARVRGTAASSVRSKGFADREGLSGGKR